MIIFIMKNAVKHFKKLRLIAKMLDLWPFSTDTLANFSFSYLVTMDHIVEVLK